MKAHTAAVYTIPEAGRFLGIGRTAAYQAARMGELPVIRIGKRILVPVKALERLLEQAGSSAPAPHNQTVKHSGVSS